MTAFATAADLSTRLAVGVFTGGELAQVNAFLEDASEFLRSEIGWQVYPKAEVTVTIPRDQCSPVRLYGHPLGAITAITVAGVDLPDITGFTVEDGILLSAGRPYHLGWTAAGSSVTYEVGYDTAPGDLKAWTLVLAAQMLADFKVLGSPGHGGVSYVALDDYRQGWFESHEPIPSRTLDRLRSTYGTGVYVTGR